ncbi:MAG: NADH-quinone oxidoreductase subunit L [Chloroflexales bacterium]|nr:NADH-quinone oxidoreductase subunit L [Chloroflexales bacterium]
MGLFLQYAWMIPVFPLLGFALITLTPIRRSKMASGWLAIGLMLAATIFALGLLIGVAQGLHLDEDGQITVVHTEVHGAEGEDEHGVETVAAEDEDEHHSFAFPEANVVQRIAWAPTGMTSFEMGVYVDPVVAAMLAMVTIASTCIHLFSLGYMATNKRQSRFFSFISLFTAAMLVMTMADNLLLFFMAWEIMGLCSYLLIGFLFERPQAYRAAVKAFLTTRVGDVLMLIGLVYLYTQAGSLALGMGEGQIFNTEFLERIAFETNALGMSHATAIALLLFCGTVGKSAQFPLHVWLPDAMEGPTPVSALIHAATMVAAGVFLVGRTYPIFAADDGTALFWVAFIGAFTALFAAIIAVAQFDIKRILAYSTLSQLGFMVAALGIGGWVAGIFHLLTHAFFKALLFLGSGSVIHAMEATPKIEEIHHKDEYAAQQTAQDIRNMGDLRRRLPWTFWTYTAGYLALAGIVPFAGFWSKDEILADAFKNGHWVVFGVLVVAAFLTAFYMTRQWRVVFFGAYRGDNPLVFVNPEAPATPTHHDSDAGTGAYDEAGRQADHTQHGNRWHEDPAMTASLVVLASFAVTAGFFNLPSLFPFTVPGEHWLSSLLGQEALPFSFVVAGISLLVAVAGIAAGWFYANAFKTAQDRDPLEARAAGLFAVLNNKFYIDEIYALTIGQLSSGLTKVWSWIDRNILDRIVNATGSFTLFLSRLNFIVDDTLLNDGPDTLARGTVDTGDEVRKIQTGRAQDYVGLIFIGVIVLALVYLYVLPG